MALILGIETTCDETGIALVEDGHKIISHHVLSQASDHERFGGVFPELASRLHVPALPLLFNKTLEESGKSAEDIDAIAVAYGPGLVGALLAGLQFAKGLCIGLKKPLIAVNHVEAHLFAAAMNKNPEFPALGVVVSGGHTTLLLIKAIGFYEVLGETIDDAIGESFDKVAIMLGLSYPGGPLIEKIAKTGNPHLYPFKSGKVQERPLSFSFSGLKTAVLQMLKNYPEAHPADVAASFQECVFKDLLSKISMTLQKTGARSLLVGGGVANNKRLQSLLQELPLPVFLPPPELTLDNAAMIAGLGYHNLLHKGPSPLSLEPATRIAF